MRISKCRRLISFVLFLVLTGLLLFSLDFAFSQPSMLRILLHQYRQGDYNAVILGQSHGEGGVDPFLLSDGDSQVFNLARRVMPLPEVYYLLREADARGQLERVYLELDVSYWRSDYLNQPTNRGTDTKMLRHLSWKLKPAYFFDLSVRQSYTEILDFRVAADTAKKVSRNIRAKLNPSYRQCTENAIPETNRIAGLAVNFDYMGRGFRSGNSRAVWYDSYQPVPFRQEDIAPLALEYFHRIADYCRQEEIQLVCFISALPPYRLTRENHDEEHAYFAGLCSSLEIPFYDFNYAKEEYLSYTDQDYVDLDGHMMGSLARQQTALFKEVLKSPTPEAYFETDYRNILEKFSENKEAAQ